MNNYPEKRNTVLLENSSPSSLK